MVEEVEVGVLTIFPGEQSLIKVTGGSDTKVFTISGAAVKNAT